MNKISNPLEYIIWCCEQQIAPSSFDILNAKDHLEKLKQQSLPYDLVGWARVNERGDLYDPRLCYNPYVPENTVMPLYANKKEFYEQYGKLSK